jgi:hypothetical protein
MKRKLDNWLVISVHNPQWCGRTQNYVSYVYAHLAEEGMVWKKLLVPQLGPHEGSVASPKLFTTFRTRAFYKMYLV